MVCFRKEISTRSRSNFFPQTGSPYVAQISLKLYSPALGRVREVNFCKSGLVYTTNSRPAGDRYISKTLSQFLPRKAAKYTKAVLVT